MNRKPTVELGVIAEFIWLEADLLDQKDYARWLTLWAEDGKYIIPIDSEESDFENSLNYAYDGAAMRDMRVRRLSSGQSVSAAHAAHTLRTVSRFRRLNHHSDREGGDKGDYDKGGENYDKDQGERGEDGDIRVRCAQNLVSYKLDKHRIYAANVSWTLRPEGDSFKIVRKIVRLINSADSLSEVTFLL